MMIMRPKFDSINVHKALLHPKLICSLIRGHDEVQLAKEHVAIHLQQVSQIKANVNELNLIRVICRAIDMFQNSCYRNQYLGWICRFLRPDKVVETGVNYGASSAFILKALDGTGGRLYSIDLPDIEYVRDDGRRHTDSIPRETKTGFVVPESLRANWRLIEGDSRERLPKLLDSIGDIDIFHHDSMHTYDLMTFEYETAWPHLKNGGLLLSDDADWNEAFKDFCYRRSAEHCIHRSIGIALKSG
jgi:predicted O-methyltransferase YrrM